MSRPQSLVPDSAPPGVGNVIPLGRPASQPTPGRGRTRTSCAGSTIGWPRWCRTWSRPGGTTWPGRDAGSDAIRAGGHPARPRSAGDAPGADHDRRQADPAEHVLLGLGRAGGRARDGHDRRGPGRRRAGAAAHLRPDPRRRDGRVGLPPRPAVGAHPGRPAAPAQRGPGQRAAGSARASPSWSATWPTPRPTTWSPSCRRPCGGSGGCW